MLVFSVFLLVKCLVMFLMGLMWLWWLDWWMLDWVEGMALNGFITLR